VRGRPATLNHLVPLPTIEAYISGATVAVTDGTPII